MKSIFNCPACGNKLEMEMYPKQTTKNPKPYVQVWCGVGKCPSLTANNNGGSGPTEEAAYRSLCAAVDNEATETDPWDGPSTEEVKERTADKTADHQRKRAIGL